MLGLILIAVTLLVANVKIYQRNAAERNRARRENEVALEERFQKNCTDAGLTQREIEIVLLVRKGYKNKQIAGELFIAEKTVDTHMQNIYAKAGERSRLALINKLNR